MSSSFVCLAQGLGFATIMSLSFVPIAQGFRVKFVVCSSCSRFKVNNIDKFVIFSYYQGFCDEFIANGTEHHILAKLLEIKCLKMLHNVNTR